MVVGKKVSDEFLLEELKRFYNENRRSPKYNDLGHDTGYPCIDVYINHFGSFNTALQLSGLPVNTCRGYSRSFLIDELKRFVSENNRLPLKKEMSLKNGYPNHTVYTRKFSSWEDAIVCAGFGDYNEQINKQFLIDELKRFVSENNRSPTSRDIDDKNSGYPSSSRYVFQFGSFNNGLLAAGLKLNVHNNCTREELLDKIIQFEKIHGRPPGYREFESKNGYPGAALYVKEFGSFSNALAECGFIAARRLHTYDGTECCSKCGSTKTYSGWCYDKNDNIMCRKCANTIWFANHPEKMKQYKHIQDSKRRGYGTTLLNEFFFGSNGHHVWEEGSEFVIFMPEFLHTLHWHSHNKEETMTSPNALAFDYWVNEDLYTKLYSEGEP